MQNKFEEIYEQFTKPASKYTRIRDTPIYHHIFMLYSGMFSRELAVFLLDKMKKGHKKANVIFHALMNTKGYPVPPDALLLHKHSGNNDFENYREELIQFN